MNTFDPIALCTMQNLLDLRQNLLLTDDLNTERELFIQMVDELYYILVLEA